MGSRQLAHVQGPDVRAAERVLVEQRESVLERRRVSATAAMTDPALVRPPWSALPVGRARTPATTVPVASRGRP